MSAEELFAEFGSGLSAVYTQYVDTVANGPLQKYKAVIHDRGLKKGEPLFAHVMSGVGVLARLAELLTLTEEETSVLLAAFTVHDLNKLPQFDAEQLPFNKLATPENVAEALEDIQIEAFFPEWQNYLEDITLLVRIHSGHHHTAGEFLVKNRDPYALGRETLDRLIPLIRAADVADLSRTLGERANKAKLLGYVNQISPTLFDFASHRIAEQRGLLTNLLHQTAQSFLDECGWFPLLFYPDGIAYLVPHNAAPFDRADYQSLACRFSETVEARMSSGFAQFIRSTNQGIKIEPQCLEQNATTLWREVLAKIQGSAYSARVERLITAMEQRLRRQAQTDERAAALLEAGVHQLPSNDVTLRLGELVRTYYIFLADHDYGQGQPEPWARLYELLAIPEETYAQWTPLDARYDRGYVVGQWLAERGDTLQSVWPKLVGDAERLCGGTDEKETEDTTLAEYAQWNLSISRADSSKIDWGAGLRRYIANQHRQCSLCGSSFATQEWMAADVPPKQKVQQFSNRLLAGSTREPKRYVCAVCRTQYMLDKLAFRTPDATTRYFVHFYPYTFFTPDYLESIRNSFRRGQAEGIEALLTNVGKSWRNRESGYPHLTLIPKTTAIGMPIPQFSEAVGNIFTTPINAPGDNATERFLHALQTALLWKIWLGCRVALTDSPEPPFGGGWERDLFIDGVPASMRGLVPANELGADSGGRLVEQFTALHQLQALALDPKSKRDPLVLLARSLSLDALEPFWVMDRLILRKADSSKQANPTFLRRDALPHLEILLGDDRKEETLSHIKRMAEIAWEGKLKGDSLKDTALAKPLDAALGALGGYDKTTETLEDLRAVTSKEVEEAIERVTDPKYWGKTKIGYIEQFVNILFDGLLAKTYRGDVSALLTNRRRIRAAYLHYAAAQFRSKDGDKEEKA